MKLAETVKLLVRGLLKLGSAEEPPPQIRPAARLEPMEEKTPVYSLESPAPVWRSGSGTSLAAAPAVEYPALNASKPAPNREDLAELVYRRIDFDSRLTSQRMDEEEV